MSLPRVTQPQFAPCRQRDAGSSQPFHLASGYFKAARAPLSGGHPASQALGWVLCTSHHNSPMKRILLYPALEQCSMGHKCRGQDSNPQPIRPGTGRPHPSPSSHSDADVSPLLLPSSPSLFLTLTGAMASPLHLKSGWLPRMETCPLSAYTVGKRV